MASHTVSGVKGAHEDVDVCSDEYCDLGDLEITHIEPCTARRWVSMKVKIILPLQRSFKGCASVTRPLAIAHLLDRESASHNRPVKADSTYSPSAQIR